MTQQQHESEDQETTSKKAPENGRSLSNTGLSSKRDDDNPQAARLAIHDRSKNFRQRKEDEKTPPAHRDVRSRSPRRDKPPGFLTAKSSSATPQQQQQPGAVSVSNDNDITVKSARSTRFYQQRTNDKPSEPTPAPTTRRLLSKSPPRRSKQRGDAHSPSTLRRVKERGASPTKPHEAYFDNPTIKEHRVGLRVRGIQSRCRKEATPKNDTHDCDYSPSSEQFAESNNDTATHDNSRDYDDDDVIPPPTTRLRVGATAQPPTVPGAIRVEGMDATLRNQSTTATAAAAVAAATGDTEDGRADQTIHDEKLVQAEEVKEPTRIRAQAVGSLSRLRKMILLGLSIIVVVGLSVGLLVGTLLRDDPQADVSIVFVNKTKTDHRQTDFAANWTVPASTCFATMAELYEAVDEYASLTGLVSTAADYVAIRNESLRRRDALAGVYGWPIGEFCVSRLVSLSGVFSAFRADELVGFNDDVSAWNVSRVRNLDNIFYGNSDFNQPLDRWDTSRVTSMEGAFQDAIAFNQSLSSWNVSRVRNMNRMFRNTISFNRPLGSWDTRNVESMARMFQFATAFNQDISRWNVGRVRTMERMFQLAESFNQDLSRWNVAVGVVRMAGMFLSAASFNQPSMCNWSMAMSERQRNLPSVLLPLVLGMFEGTMCAETGNPDPFNWPQSRFCGDCAAYYDALIAEVTANDTLALDANVAFESTAELQQVIDEYMKLKLPRLFPGDNAAATKTRLAETYGWPMAKWNVSLVTDFSGLFSSERVIWMGLFNDDISDWDVSNGETFAWMFSGAGLFDSDLSRWNVSKATDLSGMFGGNTSSWGALLGAARFNANLSSWDVARVTNMAYMFQSARDFDQDLSRWNTGNVETMEFMLNRAVAFSSDLPWNVSKVRSFRFTFATSSLSGSVGQWDTSLATTMEYMFSNTRDFNQDLSGWNVTSVTSMKGMFHNSSFNQDISNWDPVNCVFFNEMFWRSAFNQSLCNWGPWVGQRGRRTTSMFFLSHCTNQGMPDVLQDPVGPLCTAC